MAGMMMPLASGTWNHHSNMKKKAAMTPTEMASAFRKPVLPSVMIEKTRKSPPDR